MSGANVIVRDDGFAADDWTGGIASLDAAASARGVDLPSDGDTAPLAPHLDRLEMIRVDFPSFADGRGFTLGKRLRDLGFTGRLRAHGQLIADQYAMARRAGFDEVEIPPETAARQPEPQWLARADWHSGDYRARLAAPALSDS